MIVSGDISLAWILFLGLVSVLVYSLTSFFERLAPRLSLMDYPNHRSAHDHPVVRGGGAVFVLVFLGVELAYFLFAQSSFMNPILLSVLLAVAVVGLLDDRYTLPRLPRLIVQIAFALVVVLQIGMPESWLEVFPAFVGGAVAVVALVWWVNLFNFMDGSDGFAASEAVFLAASLSFFAWLNHDAELVWVSGLLCAVTLGFLIRNWPPARIFMGDVGSLFLGSALALLMWSALTRWESVNLPGLLVLTAPFWLDATVTLLKRLFRGERVWEAHRSHYYQSIMLQNGKRALLSYLWLLNTVLVFPVAFWLMV
jgi:Fuc2NAc and GlcNAc transferase